MAKNKDSEKKVIWFLLALLGVYLLFGGNGLLQSTVTICENIEPASFPAFVAELDPTGGTIIDAGTFPLVEEEGTINLNRYNVYITGVGAFDVINPDNFVCSVVVKNKNINDNQSEYFSINNKKTLLTSEGEYMWCNENNNMVIIAKETTVLVRYVDNYQKCSQQAGPDYVTDKDVCAASYGEMEEGLCYCLDDNLLEIGDLCPAPVIGNLEEIDTEEDDSSTTPGTSITSAGSTTTPTPTTTSITEEKFDLTGWLWFGGIFVLLFALYWIFEKGPEKGFIRGKRK